MNVRPAATDTRKQAILHRRRPVLFVVALLVVATSVLPATSSLASISAGSTGLQAASFTLDNVTLDLSVPYLPSSFGVARPGNAGQVASFAALRPYREFSVTASPFGTRPGTESLPVARAGGSAAYYAALRDYRTNQGGHPVDGPIADIFGRQVPGQVSLVGLPLYGSVLRPTVIVEWVVEAGNRLWIIRAAEEQTTAGASGQGPSLTSPFLSSLPKMRLSSNSLANPTTVRTMDDGQRTIAVGKPPSQPSSSIVHPSQAQDPSPVVPNDLPFPAWWNGSDCDYTHYYNGSGGLGSYRLGAQYAGMVACGPRPIGDGAPDVLVHFFTGSWGEFDFECVELAMRYLYLSYGIAPYEANGNTVVAHYSSSYGGNLQQAQNGVPGTVPQPGDVLSYGGASTFGHASVVSSSNVDGSGNGTITVIEENNARSGQSTLTVANWFVGGNAGSVLGWLTPSGGGPVPTDTPTEVATDTPTATPTPACPGERFSDVCPGEYFYQPVLYLNDHGAISGYADGTFRPYNNTTRGQLCKIVVLAAGWPIDTTGGPHFLDVSSDNPFYTFIETAYNRAAIAGYADGTFRWGANITRGQLSKVIVIAQGWPINPGAPSFSDVPTTDPFYAYIETAHSHGVISGYADGTFRPGSTATRGQIAKIVYMATSP